MHSRVVGGGVVAGDNGLQTIVSGAGLHIRTFIPSQVTILTFIEDVNPELH